MKKINLYVIGLEVCGVGLNEALAQEATDDGGAAGAAAESALLSTESLVARYLVTYLKSRTDAPRSATVVTVTNQANRSCAVKIDWFLGFAPDTPACTTTAVLAPGVTHDFCSRGLLANITTLTVPVIRNLPLLKVRPSYPQAHAAASGSNPACTTQAEIPVTPGWKRSVTPRLCGYPKVTEGIEATGSHRG